MDVKRRAFLAGIEADLTAVTARTATAVHPKRVAGKVGAFAATFLAGAALFTLSATGANASADSDQGSRVQEVAMIPDPFVPDHIAQSHDKPGPGRAIQRYIYITTYSPNGGLIRCHVFDHHTFSCQAWNYVGRKESCGH